MTEPAAPPRGRVALPKRPGPLAVFATSAGTFCVALAFRAGQARTGEDPACTPDSASSAATSA